MSPSERALLRLALPRAVLAERDGRFNVFPNGDKRRRAGLKLSAAEKNALESSGAIAPLAGQSGYVITEAGRAQARRLLSPQNEAYAAQHGPVVDRNVVDRDGGLQAARGYEPSRVLRRLAALRDAGGQPWLEHAELLAAARLRSHWEASQAGLMRGSDWTAPPNAKGARGASSAQEAALAARCDAQRRYCDAMERLAAPLRRVVEGVCLKEEGLEEIERFEAWPARSGKLALKLGLAQLATVL
ncbi:MAG: DUF6456 domain-containing protein [Terricaulis sp.]